MPEATDTVEIARPPADVFAFLADGTNGPRWRSGVIDVAHQAGEGKGAVYTQGVNCPFGRRVPADYELTAYEPDRRIAFRAIAGPVRPEGAYDLEVAGDGTRATFSLRCTPTGFARLMAPMVAKTMRSEVAQLAQLARLRELLEG